MKRAFIISGSILGAILFSCKSPHFIKSKIKASADSIQVGIIVQYNNAEDTSDILPTIKESLEDCKLSAIDGFFKKEIYKKENFDPLFNVDVAFISAQPTLSNLNQILVIKLDYIEKVDEVTGKKYVWGTLLGRWISLSPIKKMYDFYYVEKILYTGSIEDKQMVNSFIRSQIHVKLCYDIQQHIFKKK